MYTAKPFGEAVKNNKSEYFVGREQERYLFDRFLKRTKSPAAIINISGIGGIGKSSLLDQYNRIASEKGMAVYTIDSQDFSHTPQEFTYFLAHLFHIPTKANTSFMDVLRQCIAHVKNQSRKQRVVFALDTYEQMLSLDRWFRDVFISQLPQNITLIICGRVALRHLWRADPHWCELVQSVALESFTLTEVQQYAGHFGIHDPQIQRKLFKLTLGHPLVLTLVLEIKKETETNTSLIHLLRKNLNRIVYQWLREIENEKIRQMVEAASLVRQFDQSLLEYIFDDLITPDEFQQLTKLSFIRETSSGWNVHNILQKNITKEIRLRTPDHYNALWKRIIFYYYKRLLNEPVQDKRAKWMEELFYVLGDSMVRTIFFEERSEVHFSGEIANETHYDEVKQFLQNLIERFQSLSVNVEFLDSLQEEEYVHHMPVSYFKREAQLLIEEQLMLLDMEAFHLIRNERGESVGLIVNVPIHEQTIDYLLRSPVSSGYFSQLTDKELDEYAVSADERSGCFLRLIGFQDDNDSAARTALMYYLLSLWLKEPRSVVTTAFPFYIELLKRIGFEKVAGASHQHYGPQFIAPTFLLDLREERLLQFLDRMVASADVSVSPILLNKQFNLTPREQEVTHFVIECLTNAEIAERMHISEITVKKHLSNIFEKAKVNNKMELLKKVYDSVLVS